MRRNNGRARLQGVTSATSVNMMPGRPSKSNFLSSVGPSCAAAHKFICWLVGREAKKPRTSSTSAVLSRAVTTVWTCKKLRNEGFGGVLGLGAGSDIARASNLPHFRIRAQKNDLKGTTTRTNGPEPPKRYQTVISNHPPPARRATPPPAAPKIRKYSPTTTISVSFSPTPPKYALG